MASRIYCEDCQRDQRERARKRYHERVQVAMPVVSSAVDARRALQAALRHAHIGRCPMTSAPTSARSSTACTMRGHATAPC